MPEPVFPRRSSRRGVEPLRYFEYFPPIPGYADAYPGCLTAVIPFVGTALLERILDAVGQKIELPLKHIQEDLGFVPVEGKPLSVCITVDPKGPPCPEVTLFLILKDLPEGVSVEELAWARRVEALLEARGVPPSRTAAPEELESLSYFRLAPPSPGRALFHWDSLVARISAPDEGALRQILAALGQKEIPVSGVLGIADFKVQIWVRSAPGVEGPVPAVVELWLDAAPPPWVSLRELEQVRRVEALLARAGVPVS